MKKNIKFLIFLILIIILNPLYMSKSVYYAKDMPGKLAREISGNSVTNAQQSINNYLTYGPYAKLAAGVYKISVFYELAENSEAFVDVATSGGKNILGKYNLSQTTKKIKKKIFLKSSAEVEVRTYITKGQLTLHKIKIYGLSVPSFLLSVALIWLLLLIYEKKNRYRDIFIILLVACFSIPLGSIIGLKEHTLLYGSDPLTDLPSLQEQSYIKKDFQKQFEAWWTSHYLFRKKALKLKNQLYDWANFGLIHSGYSGNVIEGKEEYLFERGYFNSLKQQCSSIPVQSFTKIKKLKKALDENGIAMYVILAPNKALTYQEYLPARYRYFLGADCNYYKAVETELQKMGIAVYNAQNLALEIKNQEKYPPFFKTGTHWNLYAAGRTLQDSFKSFNLPDIIMSGVETADIPYFTERDIANLLNLIFPYTTEEKFVQPLLQSQEPLPGKTALIGNSFSNEYKVNMLAAKAVTQESLIHIGNPPLSDAQAQQIMQCRRIFFVYTDLPFINSQDQLYKKIDVLLKNADKNTKHILFADKTQNIFTSGLSHHEKWGRWSNGKEVAIKLEADKDASAYQLSFNVKPYINIRHPRQTVFVKVNGKEVAQWHFDIDKTSPDLTLNIDKDKLTKDGKLELHFTVADPKSPYELGLSSDKRLLGLGFIEITLKALKKPAA